VESGAPSTKPTEKRREEKEEKSNSSPRLLGDAVTSYASAEVAHSINDNDVAKRNIDFHRARSGSASDPHPRPLLLRPEEGQPRPHWPILWPFPPL